MYGQKVSIHFTIAIRASNQFESTDVSHCYVGSLVLAGFLFFCVCHTLIYGLVCSQYRNRTCA